MRRDRELEIPVRLGQEALPEAGPPQLQHQLEVLAETEGHDPFVGAERPCPVAELEQRFAQSGQGILIVGVECNRRLEASAGPRVVLAGKVGVGGADVEFHRVGIQREPLTQQRECFLVGSLIVELVGLFVELVGAAECIRHRQGASRAGWSILRTPAPAGKSLGRNRLEISIANGGKGLPHLKRHHCDSVPSDYITDQSVISGAVCRD